MTSYSHPYTGPNLYDILQNILKKCWQLKILLIVDMGKNTEAFLLPTEERISHRFGIVIFG